MTPGPTRPTRERWLVLTHSAGIDGSASSHHIDDRLRHLLRAGVQVEIITSTCGPRPRGWGRKWHRVPSVTATGYQFEVRQITRPIRRPWRRIVRLLLTLPVMPMYAAEKHITRLHSTFWWCISAAISGLWYTRGERYDLIYSTGGAMSAHVAAALIARLRRLPWIAEMQDPIIYQGFGRGPLAAFLARRLERIVHTRSTGAVYVTRSAAQHALQRSGGSARCAVIRPGADRVTSLLAPQRSQHMELVHVGTLAGPRNPRTLLEALSRLATRRSSVRQAVRLTLVGNMGRDIRHMVGEFPYPNMVRLSGRIPRQGAREITASADLLLLIQHRSAVSAETIPCKTYEYLVSGRPVLGLTFRNVELAALLCEAGHQCVEVDDVEGIERALESAYERWRQGRLSAAPFLRYQVESAAEALVAWSHRLRGQGRPSQKHNEGWEEIPASPSQLVAIATEHSDETAPTL